MLSVLQEKQEFKKMMNTFFQPAIDDLATCGIFHPGENRTKVKTASDWLKVKGINTQSDMWKDYGLG